jgi:succinate dehydrogenase/fumarate reductase flavoprotein subunit
MTEPGTKNALNRRELLLGLGAGVTAGFMHSVGAVPAAQIKSWDVTTDVLVSGSGASGICAALAAREAGAQVLVIETLAEFGGASALSAGVIYAGGGTALQRALSVEDSPEDMYNFIVAAGGRHPQLDKVQLYCEQSVAHFDWLFELGIPYVDKLASGKGVPLGDESLYYSGNELAWPSSAAARPVARGHLPGEAGANGGRTLMAVMLSRARAAGVLLKASTSAEQLILEADGRVAGVQVMTGGVTSNIRARRAVVLACGGFIHNREMVRNYAPQLYDCSVPWGGAGDLGRGINMGIAVGAAALRMHEGVAMTPISPPDNVISGILVNRFGQRFVSEESYPGVLGHNIAYQQEGKSWLISDYRSGFDGQQDNFLQVAKGNTIGDVAEQLEFPRGALQQTVAFYNRYAQNGIDPLFQKSAAYLRPLQGPPYTAWDTSVDRAFFPAHTLGGLHTLSTGHVLNSAGEPIPGLFAAGRNSAGLPTAPYSAGGLSLGDCTFFGRRAGAAAAAQPL